MKIKRNANVRQGKHPASCLFLGTSHLRACLQIGGVRKVYVLLYASIPVFVGIVRIEIDK